MADVEIHFIWAVFMFGSVFLIADAIEELGENPFTIRMEMDNNTVEATENIQEAVESKTKEINETALNKTCYEWCVLEGVSQGKNINISRPPSKEGCVFNFKEMYPLGIEKEENEGHSFEITRTWCVK